MSIYLTSKEPNLPILFSREIFNLNLSNYNKSNNFEFEILRNGDIADIIGLTLYLENDDYLDILLNMSIQLYDNYNKTLILINIDKYKRIEYVENNKRRYNTNCERKKF